MTDWLGVARTIAAADAGLDLQMPGPARFYGPALAAAVEAGDVPEDVLDAIVRRWLGVIDRLGAWHDEPVREQSVDRPEHRVLARRAAAGGDRAAAQRRRAAACERRWAARRVIGPNASRAHIMGGGSAELLPHYRVSLLEVLEARLGDRVAFEPGCSIDKTVRALGRGHARTPDGQPGVLVEYFSTPDWSGEPAEQSVSDTCRLFTFGRARGGLRRALVLAARHVRDH